MAVTSGGTTTTTHFAVDGDTTVREMRSISGTLTPTATYFNGMYRRDDLNGSLRWYVFDGLGSVVGEVDPSGNLTCNRGYDVYGATRSSTGTPTSKHGFVGQLGHPTDDETGLEYMRARYYDPQVGRFLNEDPKGGGWNWFAYAGSNPVCCADRDGRYSIYATGGAIAWFIYITAQFIKTDNVSNIKNDLKYMWGMVATALIFQASNPTGVASNIWKQTRAIAEWADSAKGVPYANTMTAAAAGYGLFLLYAEQWCTDFEGDKPVPTLAPAGKV